MAEVPAYATRPSANGTISTYSLPARLLFTICTLITLNVLGWSIFGLVALAEKAATLLG